MSEAVLAIRLDAGSDHSGNPRRVYVVFDKDANILDAIDEEYKGSGAVTKKYPNLPHFPTFKTTVAEYRDVLKNWRKVR